MNPPHADASPGDQTPSRRSVAWLCSGEERYGVRRAAVNLMTSVRTILGWDISAVCVTRGPMSDDLRALDVPVTDLDLAPPPMLAGNPIRAVRALHRLGGDVAEAALRAGVPRTDILHVQWPNLVAAVGRTARALGCGGAVWEMPNAVSRRLFGLNALVYQVVCRRHGVQPLANSAFTARSLGDGLVTPWVFHLGADPARFNPDAPAFDRAALHIPPDAPVLVIAARVTEAKGQLVTTQALAEVDADLHLVLVGGPTDDAHADAIRDAATRAGAAHRVHFAGLVDDPERYYAGADIVGNMRVDPEPFGLSVIEAMMMGRPVLAHALGGPAETVVDGVTGWHYHDPTPDAIADAIRRALDERPRWGEMGDAGRARALERFSLAAQTERFRQAVEAVLAGETAPPPALRLPDA